jgi:hypothetical protein
MPAVKVSSMKNMADIPGSPNSTSGKEELIKEMVEIRRLAQTVGSTASDAFATVIHIRLIAEMALAPYET